MATQSTTYGMGFRLGKSDNCDKELQEIVSQMHDYLYHFGDNRLFLVLARSYFQKCCRSWSRVTAHLEKFLQDPKSNYSLLVVVLEHEIQKFPEHSFFYKKLKEMELLISLGPQFTFKTFSVIN